MDKKWKFLTAILILGVFGIICSHPFETRFFVYELLGSKGWEENTIPLDDETQAYLCDLFDISFWGLCDPNFEVYGADFYYSLDNYVRAGNLQTHEDWDRELGRFLMGCDHSKEFISSEGTLYYQCRYDFAGDGLYRVVAFFNEDGSLRKHVHGD